MKPKQLLFALLPVGLAAAGVIWMQVAVWHFEEATGREFYGLAGYCYSAPESGFAYHSGGENIHRWTTKIPGATTLAGLIFSLFVVVGICRKAGVKLLTILVGAHVCVAAVFGVVWILFEINITGLFI